MRSRLIAWLRVLLPLAALAILSTLFLLGRTPDPDDALPYAEVDAEDMVRDPRMTRPEFAGVSKSESEVTVTADLPGLTEKDVEVSIDHDLLTIRGRREVEREEKKHNYHVMERSYGEFHRVVPVPDSAEGTKAKATFKNGVLKLVMPKKPEAGSQRRLIPVDSA